MDTEKNNEFVSLVAEIKEELLDEVPINTSENSENAESPELTSNQERAPDSREKLTPMKCVYCSMILSLIHKPKLLECLHSACSDCVQKKFSEIDRTLPSLIHCSSCNRASQHEFIIDNYFVSENNSDLNFEEKGKEESKTSDAESINCSSCNDNALATSWCVECSEFICDNCVQAHQRLKITKDHSIKPKDEALNLKLLGSGNASNSINSVIPSNEKCEIHSEERLSLYCETCTKLTCRDCQLVDHRDHKYKFACEAAQETRSKLKALSKEIDYKKFLLTSALKVIDERQVLVSDKKKELIKEVTNIFVKLTDTVNMRGKQLVMRVNEICDSKLKILTEKREALRSLLENVDHCIGFVDSAIVSGSDSALLYSRISLGRHLQNLKCQRADIPNPEIPVRIHVQLNQVGELIKVISQMGAVIVDGKSFPPPPPPPSACNGPIRQQPPSPNVVSPIRGNIPQVIGPAPHMFTNTPQQFNNMSRNFSPDPNHRFPTLCPPVPMVRNGQPHVSSSTHPQNMGQGSNINYSGPSFHGNSPSPSNHQNLNTSQMRPHFMGGGSIQQHQSFQQPAAGNSNTYINNPRFQRYQGISSPNSLQRQQILQNQNMGYPGMPNAALNISANVPQMLPGMPSVAKWHIPQSNQQINGVNAMGNMNQSVKLGNNGSRHENFKIALKSPTSFKHSVSNAISSPIASANHIHNVSSTNPKTPSPITSKDFIDPMDRARDDSINDLMATIAKLDSNGVQVLPEGRNKTNSPQVHSSTMLDEVKHADTKEDPNEDWCAVCLDGGELMCCDKCPKVFHQNCHIPPINSLPDESETWQCLLCISVNEISGANLEINKRPGELSPNELKVIQRICLELYCQYEQSLYFREPEPATNTSYYEIICNPITLDMVRIKLDPANINHYRDISTFVSDIRLIFKNATLFYQEDTKIYSNAIYMNNFFEEQLQKWLPVYASNIDIINPAKRRRTSLTEQVP